jgi:hypothetical protein
MPKPSNAGKRYVVLEPTYLSSDVDVDVWIDGKLQVREHLDNKKLLYKHATYSKFHGWFKIKIKLKSGNITLSSKDAYGLYPSVYDNYEGLAPIRQLVNVDVWIGNPVLTSEKGNTLPDNDLDIHLESGDILEFDHIWPNGPEWLDIFFHKESHRLKFIETGLLSHSMVNESHVVGRADYYPVDMNLSPKQRSEKLIVTAKEESEDE